MVVRRGRQRYGFTAHNKRDTPGSSQQSTDLARQRDGRASTTDDDDAVVVLLLLDGYSVAELMRVINTRPI